MKQIDKTHDMKFVERCPDEELREIMLTAHREFPLRLHSIRKGAKLTLREVGELTGISWQQLYRYERGEDLPKFTNLCLLAAFYGVTVDWLMGGEWN